MHFNVKVDINRQSSVSPKFNGLSYAYLDPCPLLWTTLISKVPDPPKRVKTVKYTGHFCCEYTGHLQNQMDNFQVSPVDETTWKTPPPLPCTMCNLPFLPALHAHLPSP